MRMRMIEVKNNNVILNLSVVEKRYSQLNGYEEEFKKLKVSIKEIINKRNIENRTTYINNSYVFKTIDNSSKLEIHDAINKIIFSLSCRLELMNM